MPVNLSIGDRVDIKAGDEKGGWGIIRLVETIYHPFRKSTYHVMLYGDPLDVRIYSRSEISKPRTRKETQ